MKESLDSTKADQISYVELIRLVLLKKKIIGYTLLFFVIMGTLIITTSPVEYESSAITISEFKEEGIGNLGQIGSLAGLAGINLPSTNSSSFSPTMYPDVISSRSFLLDLINEEFHFETKGKNMTLKDYYLEERPGNFLVKGFRFLMSIPSRLLGLFSPDNQAGKEGSEENDALPNGVLRTTSADEFAVSELRKRITIENNQQLFTLKVKSPEPLISARLNSMILDKLIQYVTEYLTEKHRNNLKFVEERTKEAEQEYIKSQLALANFRDSNQGIVTQRARTREEFLQSEYNIAFNLYSTLKQQQEQSFIQVKKETPVFTTIEPAVVPLGKAEPRSSLIFAISLFLGLFVGLGIVVALILLDFYKHTFQGYEQDSNGGPSGPI